MTPENTDDVVYRLRKRSEIRRQIQSRKSVQEGKPDRISDLLDESAKEIESLRNRIASMSNESWQVIIEPDENGDVILPFPADMIKKYGWQPGDKLEWEIIDRGAVIRNVTAEQRKNNTDIA